MRNVILHMHFPKTGGTTLSDILDREFGERHRKLSFFRLKRPDEFGNTHVPWKYVLYKYGTADLEADWDFVEADLVDVLKRDKNTSALSRHGMIIRPSTITMMAKTGLDCRILPVFFLRRFLPWHVSLYLQQRRDPEYMVRLSCDPEVMVAKTGTLEEYTRYCIGSTDSHKRHKLMYNWTANDADSMIAKIKMYQIGLVERYNESLVVIEDALGEYFPGLDLSYGSPLNVHKQGSGAMAVQHTRDLEIGTDLAEDLSKMGTWSDGIYDRVRKELDFRISCVSNFCVKLKDFESRCRARRCDRPRNVPPTHHTATGSP